MILGLSSFFALAAVALAVPTSRDEGVARGGTSMTEEVFDDSFHYFDGRFPGVTPNIKVRFAGGAAEENFVGALDGREVFKDALPYFKDEFSRPAVELDEEEMFEDALPYFEEELNAKSADRTPFVGASDGTAGKLSKFSKPPTEEELSDAGKLSIRFNNQELVTLLDHVFETKPPSDEQFRTAVEQKNGRELYILSRCPICLNILHSETLVTTRCHHEMHKACLDGVPGGRCPVCLDSEPYPVVKVPTLLKKSLELFENEGVIPPKPDVPVYSLMSVIGRQMQLAGLVIKEIAEALENTAAKTKERDGAQVVDDMIMALSHDHAIPRAIWGITVFDRSPDHMTPESLAVNPGIAELNEEKRKKLGEVIRDYAEPAPRAFQRRVALVEKIEYVRQIFLSTFRDRTAHVPSHEGQLSRSTETLFMTFLKSKTFAQLLSDPDSDDSAKNYVQLLFALSAEVNDKVRELLRAEMESSESFHANRQDWVRRLVSLRLLVSVLIDNTIASKSRGMQLYEHQGEILLVRLVQDLPSDVVVLKFDDGSQKTVNLERLRLRGRQIASRRVY